MLDRIVMLLAGQAAEKLLIGEGTDGSIHDLASATGMAMMRINAGLDPRAPFIDIYGFSHSRPPDELWDAIGAAVLQTLSESRDRADVLATEHRDHIVAFAQKLHDARRLTDGALTEAIRETGQVSRS
jgi:ATP-dependent Zn protease